MDKTRCFGSGDRLYESYHDEEWGRPLSVTSDDERELFERLALEGFLSGLSWLTILRKREEFRRVFHDFVPEAVAAFGPDEVEALLGNAGIIRNRRKIEAAIGNAQALVGLHESGILLGDLLADALPPPRPARVASTSELPASTPESRQLSGDLKRLGFRFIGPITVYSMWQAVGMIDDHVADCWLVTEGRLGPLPGVSE